jgi:hypothetical protein
MKIVDRLLLTYNACIATDKAANKAGVASYFVVIPEIQVCRGIEKLAEEAGKAVKTEPYDNPDFPVKKSFEYRGVTFFQIGSESVETEVHHA